MEGQIVVAEPQLEMPAIADPFAEDRLHWRPDDAQRPALVRLAIVATTVGARFERDGLACDPMAWMLSPRAMFDGESALTACLEGRAFERALVLHAQGADLGLDADPELLDELLSDDDDDVLDDELLDDIAVSELDAEAGAGPRHDPPFPQKSPEARAWRRRAAQRTHTGDRLFSTGFSQYAAGGRMLVFVAAVVDSERTFRNRLFERYGAIAALGAKVREGFDLYDTIGSRLVSDHIANELAFLATDPGKMTAEGFAVVLEWRA